MHDQGDPGMMHMHGSMDHQATAGGGMMAMTFHFSTHVSLLFDWWTAKGIWSYCAMLLIVFAAGLFYEWALLARRRRRRNIIMGNQPSWSSPYTRTRSGVTYHGIRSSQAGRVDGSANVLDGGHAGGHAGGHSQEEYARDVATGRRHAPSDPIDAETKTGSAGDADVPAMISMPAIQEETGGERDGFGALAYAATQTLGYGLMLITMTYNAGLFLAVIGGLAVGHYLWGHLPYHLPRFVGDT